MLVKTTWQHTPTHLLDTYTYTPFTKMLLYDITKIDQVETRECIHDLWSLPLGRCSSSHLYRTRRQGQGLITSTLSPLLYAPSYIMEQ